MHTEDLEEELLLQDEEARLLTGPAKKPKTAAAKPPQSYLDKRKPIEKVPLLGCLFNQSGLKLSRKNLSLFYKLAVESNTMFDDKVEEHVELLQDLFQVAFGQGRPEAAQALNDERWLSLGFQSPRPGTDFRGGGLLSLKALIFFCKQEDDFLEDIKAFGTSHDSFLFACVHIGAVFFLKNYLHFGLYGHYKRKHDARKTCGRPVLKVFLLLNGSDNFQGALTNFFLLANAYTKKLYVFWKNSCVLDKRLRIIDFKQAEVVVTQAFRTVFEREARTHGEKCNIGVFLESFDNYQIQEAILPMVIT